MCGGMGKRYEMSIAKCNTEKVFLRDIMRESKSFLRGSNPRHINSLSPLSRVLLQ